MIKRRFYRDEHGDRDEPSSASSSSSSSDDDNDNDSEVEAEATEKSDDNVEVAEVKENDESSSSSGYESEDRSAEEIDVDSLGFTNEDDGTGSDREIHVSSRLSDKHNSGVLKEEFIGLAKKESEPANMSDFVLKFKSVYKCRICPRIVCLTEETMNTHLNSKRHLRSEKLLRENRLKAMLNSDGEMENQETPAEMHARVMALAQTKTKKNNKGRQRQKKRSRMKKGRDASDTVKAKDPIKNQAKKRRKNDA